MNCIIKTHSYFGLFVEKMNADTVFGCMTVICGIFGTVAGGVVLDRIGATVSNGFKVCHFHFIILILNIVYWQSILLAEYDVPV